MRRASLEIHVIHLPMDDSVACLSVFVIVKCFCVILVRLTFWFLIS